MTTRHCGYCHECGCELVKCLDGEEWCGRCVDYKRYTSHGWGSNGQGGWSCPPPQEHEPVMEPWLEKALDAIDRRMGVKHE